MKRLLLLGVACLMTAGQIWAQRTITGTVSGADGGETLPGVNIIVKGTNIGTVTDINGRYSLEVPDNAQTLVFRYLGMKTTEVPISGGTVNVAMKTDALGLDEVVVTALGLQADRDKQGTSSTRVGGDAISRSGESSVLNGLAGKSSGLLVTRNSGDPGAGSYIQIRGQSTITGNLQPLIILDGVPITNSSKVDPIDNPNLRTDGVVQQSRLGDINPEDIASVEVIKGASAAAIWGSRAANGVVVITTKKGTGVGKKAVSAAISTSLSLDVVNREQEKQSTFGQGVSGNWSANNALSWGDKISARSGTDVTNTSGARFVADDGTIYYPITTKGDKTVYNDANRDQVFRTGVTWEKTASVATADQNSNLYVSVSDWDQKGVLKGNSDYRRSSVRANVGQNFGEHVNLNLSTYYASIRSNRVQQGSNLNGLYLGYLRTPPDFDNSDYKGTYYNASGVASFNGHRAYRRYLGDAPPVYNNPGWTLNEQENTSDVERFIVTPELNIDLAKNSRLTFRTGVDRSTDRRNTFFPANSAGTNATGRFKDEMLLEGETNYDLFLRTLNRLNADWGVTWVAGMSLNDRTYNHLGAEIFDFIIKQDPPLDLDNAVSSNSTPIDYDSRIKTARAYALADIDFRSKVFIQGSLAGEASSSYAGSTYYPSASIAYMFHDDLLGSLEWLDFAKARVSYGRVGVQPPAYITGTDYVNALVETGWGEYLDGSQYGGSVVRSSIRGNPDIKPEIKTEYEGGADYRFFDEKLAFNWTVYYNETTDAIFKIDVPGSSGYKEQWTNAGTIENTGLEMELNTDVYRTKDTRVNLYANLSMNRNRVTNLSGVKSIFLDGFTGVSSRAVEGEALGVLWGGKWARDANGNYVLDANGFPTVAAEEGILGDPNPEYRAGFGGLLSHKGFRLNVLFETAQGQDMWAGTEGVLKYFGVHPITGEETVAHKDMQNYAGATIKEGTTFRGTVENFGGGDVVLDQSWYTSVGGGFGPVGELFVKDASWTRLREVSLFYSFPASLAKSLNLESLEFGITGRNLLLWTPFEGIDPDLNLTGVSNGRGLDYFTNPGTRSTIFTLKLGI